MLTVIPVSAGIITIRSEFVESVNEVHFQKQGPNGKQNKRNSGLGKRSLKDGLEKQKLVL